MSEWLKQKPNLTQIRIIGSNQKMVNDLTSMIKASGYNILTNKHKPKVRQDKETSLYKVHILIYENLEETQQNEALYTVE